MRSSVLSLAISAGALFALAAFAAGPARAADFFGACAETPGIKLFDESMPEPVAAPPAPDARPRPKRLDAESLEPAVEVAYGDAFRMLSDDNQCSRFFGGPRVAVTVLNEFSRRLRRRMLLGAGDVGLLMSGEYTSYQDQRLGTSYRLFDEAVVNSNGPFATAPTLYGARLQIGRFPAASREGRVLMLLHELGHLIRGQDGWLLPNDGGDPALSDRNTRTVESRCIGQLLALR